MEKRLIKVLFLLCWGLIAQGFIYEVKILRKWSKEQGCYHYFIGLSDFHDKKHPGTEKQLKDLTSFLAKADKSNTHLIVEDLSSPNDQGCFECGTFYVNSRGGVLGGLTTTIKNLGLPVNNIEFRYCRVTALGPVLNNSNCLLDDIHSAQAISMSALKKEIHESMQALQSITHDVLKRQCQHAMKKVEHSLYNYGFNQCEHQSVAQYLQTNSTPGTRMSLLKNLLTFDSALLDFKMAQVVLNNQHKQQVIAIAGGAHIAHAAELLMKIGYEPVQATQVSFGREYDVNRCLGSHIINGAFCVQPQALNLEAALESIKLLK